MMLIGVLVAVLAAASALNLPGIPTEFTQDNDVLSAISEDVARRFADEFMAYKKTGVESATLRMLGKQLSATFTGKEIFTQSFADLSLSDLFGTCTLCRSTARVLAHNYLDEDGQLYGPDREQKARNTVLDICSYLHIQTEEVCGGLFDINFPYVDYILEHSKADSRSICSTLPIDLCKARQEEFNYHLTIDPTNAVITAPKSEVPQKTAGDYKVLHITDIHYDPDYVPGSLADCEEPICCQRAAPAGTDASRLAGYWSDYRSCDSPLHMIEEAFDHMAETHGDVDFIYQTGDIVPHTIWATTKEGNVQMIQKINDLIQTKFPSKPVYSCVGNHEPHPTNVFGVSDIPENLQVNWLYQALWSAWSKWLPASAQSTVLKGGYYTALVKDKLRVIALNSMDCYLLNWWVYYDGSYTIEQLNWLHDTLLEAEKNGEYVHILSHIPSGDSDCWAVWAREFNRIVERFSPIIAGIFGGHTHKDELNVHYSQNNHAMAISFNGGSLTSYSDKNPNYNVYEVEPTKHHVVDWETWIFDLVDANAKGESEKPAWFKEYTFSEAFTSDLSPAGLDALLEEMAAKPNLLRTYWKYKFTSAKPKMDVGCNDKCLKQTLCRLATSVYDAKDRCKELTAKLEESLANEDPSNPVDPENPEEPDEDDGDGASSILAFHMSTLVGVYLLLKSFF